MTPDETLAHMEEQIVTLRRGLIAQDESLNTLMRSCNLRLAEMKDRVIALETLVESEGLGEK